MKFNQFILILFLQLGLANFISKAQISDSLLTKISSKNADLKSRTIGFAQIGEELAKKNENIKFAESILLSSHKLSKQINDPKLVSKIEGALASFYLDQNNHVQALKFFNSNLTFAVMNQDEKLIAGLYNDVGLIYQKQKLFEESISIFSKALEYNTKTKNELWQAYNLKNIANSYMQMQNSDMGLTHYFKALRLFEKINDHYQCGDIYRILGKFSQSTHQLKEALDYSIKCANSYRIAQDTLRLSRALFGIANVYEGLNKPDSTEYYYYLCFNLLKSEKYEIDRAGMINNIGNLYSQKRNYEKAISYFKEALLINEKYNNTEWLMINCANLSESYNSLGDTKEAKKYFKLTESYFSQLPI